MADLMLSKPPKRLYITKYVNSGKRMLFCNFLIPMLVNYVCSFDLHMKAFWPLMYQMFAVFLLATANAARWLDFTSYELFITKSEKMQRLQDKLQGDE